jgi:hypothetical protein
MEKGLRVSAARSGSAATIIFRFQNLYLQYVVKGADRTLVLRTIAPIVKDDQDIFRDKCIMK